MSQLGARMHYAVPRILEEAGELERFFTDICADRGWAHCLRHVPASMLPGAVRRLRGRVPEGIPPQRITSFPVFGLSYALRRLAGRTQSEETARLIRAAAEFARLVKSHGFGQATGFYGFSGESLELLSAARDAGLWTVVEQIIAPRDVLDRLMVEEEETHPDWRLDRHFDRHAQAYCERERAEWAAADLVVCGSEFVRQGVLAATGGNTDCLVVPYGIDGRFTMGARPPRHGPLRILTVGAVGLRKGTPYVLGAAERVQGSAVFRLVGPIAVPDGVKARLAQSVELCGVVPRTEVLSHFAWADVFLLPSLCEGSATVAYEALAAGLPVITTVNTGTVVRDAREGFIVPIRDSDAIAEAVDRLNRDRDLLAEMSRNGVARAAEFDLANYARRLRRAFTQAREIHTERQPELAR